jgi:hypothetical protein
MNLSFGWPLLIFGVIGAFRNATAKRYFRSDFANLDGQVTEEDRRTEVHVSTLQRWLLVVLCLIMAVAGAIVIQRAHDWKPF